MKCPTFRSNHSKKEVTTNYSFDDPDTLAELEMIKNIGKYKIKNKTVRTRK